MARKPIPEVNGYGDEIVTALGALVIRASHHEAWLVSLLAAVADIRRGQAWAIYYASVNAKARLDTTKALLGVSGLSPRRRGDITAFLDRAKDLADRRNIYIHSEHSIEPYPNRRSPLRPIMTEYKSATTKRLTVRPLDLGHLHKLLDDYRATSDEIKRYLPGLEAARETRARRIALIARKTAATPSRGSASS